MIIDQLFENNKKPLNEVDPRNFDSDEDYYAALNAPVKRRSAPSDYPYSPEEDDAYFREIFRKKREAAKKAAQDKGSLSEFAEKPENGPGSDEYEDLLFHLAWEMWSDTDSAQAERKLSLLGWKPEFGDDYTAMVLYKIGNDDDHRQYTIDEFEEYGGSDDEQNVTESRRYKLEESRNLESSTYKQFHRVGRMLAERKMSEKEILDVFAQAEQAMTDKDTGANRTALGRGKDATTKFAGNVSSAVNTVLDSMRTSVPVQAVEVAYDQATDALANVAGGQKGAVMQAIKKYRMLAKEYPKTASLARSALIMIAGMASSGVAPVAIIGAVGMLDRALKGNTLFNTITGGAADTALAGATQAVAGAIAPDAATSADTSSGTGQFKDTDSMGFAGRGTAGPEAYLQPQDGQFQLPDADAAMNSQADIDAAREWINGDAETRLDIEQVTGMSPAQLQDIAVANDLANSTGSGAMPGMGGGQYEVVKGDQLGYIAQANGVSVEDIKGLNPQINWAKPLQPGTTLELPPTGDGAGSVWQGYNGGVYGDKVAGAVGDAGQGLPSNPSAASDYGMGGNAPIDYSQPGPVATDSLGQKLEYGIPVNDRGSFIPPNPELPADELATQTAAYNAWKEDFMKRWPNATQAADGSMQGIKPGLNTMQIIQKPTLPAETGLTPAQQTSLDYSQDIANPPQGYESGVAYDDDGNLMPGWNLKNVNGKDWYTTNESIKFKKLPAEKLIDQKSTVLSWALSESIGRKSASVSLTTVGTYTVFENVDRCRKALLEYVETQPGRPQLPDMYRLDMPDAPVTPTEKPGMIGRGLNWLDKKAKGVGGALSNFGHQFTTNITKEKLKMNWHQKGKPSDSDALAAWLVKQGVPQDVVTTVYSKMGIPYTAPASAETPQATQAADPAATGGAQKQMAFYGTNPATKKPWTYDELQAKARAGQTAPVADPGATDTQPTTTAAATTAASTFPGEDPTGPNYVGRREVARRQAARAAAQPAAPAKTPNFAGPSGYGKTTMTATGINPKHNYDEVTGKITPFGAIRVPARQAAQAAYNAEQDALDAKKLAAAKTTTATLPAGGGAGASGAYNAKTGAATLGGKTMTAMKDLPPHIQQQLASTVKEATRKVKPMLENATSVDDTKRIKKCIDTEFAKLGVINENVWAIRDKMLADVTQMVAIKRRDHARKS